MHTELCSIYGLTCLTKAQMQDIAAKLQSDANWHCGEPLKAVSDCIVSPRTIGGAGRFYASEIAGHKVSVSAIFSVSVPFDVMVNIEVNYKGETIKCLEKAQDYLHNVIQRLRHTIAETDILCVTFYTPPEGIREFVAFAEAGPFRGQMTLLHTSTNLVVVSASSPFECLLIVGSSEAAIADSQTAVQNLYRIKGGAQHINQYLQKLNSEIAAIEIGVKDLTVSRNPNNVADSLKRLRDLRLRLFDIEQMYYNAEVQYGNLREYEVLYIDEAGNALEPYAQLVREIKAQCLLPVRLLKQNVEGRFHNTAGFIDAALDLNYAEINLALVRGQGRLDFLQTIITVLLFVITIGQIAWGVLAYLGVPWTTYPLRREERGVSSRDLSSSSNSTLPLVLAINPATSNPPAFFESPLCLTTNVTSRPLPSNPNSP